MPSDLSSSRAHRHETEFLPAAIELIETPASPIGRWMMLSIVGLIATAVLWATLGSVDIIVTAEGRVIPTGKVKAVQPLEIGVVKAIHIQDGKKVAAGDILIELDPTSNTADSAKQKRELMRARLDAARLTALLSDNPPDTLPNSSDLKDATDAERATAESELRAQRDERRLKVQTLDRQIAQRRAELAGVKATIAKLDDSIPLMQKRVEIRENGLKTEFGNKMDYLAQQQQWLEARNDRVVQMARADEVAQGVAALERERDRTSAEFRRTDLADLAKAQDQINQLTQEIIKSEQKTDLQTLRASVAGTVQQLSVHTIGGVVTPAQTLAVLVPQDAALELEASIANRDVGFVQVGQEVEIKVEAFLFTRYGLLHGRVASLSRDAQVGDGKERNGLTGASGEERGNSNLEARSLYTVRIALDQDWITTEQGRSPLSPGMAATAEIKTGSRSLITYLLSPLTRYRHDAARER